MDNDKIINNNIKEDNYKVFAILSHYLNHAPNYISKKEIDEIAKSVYQLNMLSQ